MMQNFDRTLELVNISSNSYGATLAQQAKYMEGLEAKVTLLNNAYENLITSFVNSDAVIWVIEQVTNLLEFAKENTWAIITPLALIGTHWLVNTVYMKAYNKAVLEQQEEEKKNEIEKLKLEQQNLDAIFAADKAQLKSKHDLQLAEQEAKITQIKNHRLKITEIYTEARIALEQKKKLATSEAEKLEIDAQLAKQSREYAEAINPVYEAERDAIAQKKELVAAQELELQNLGKQQQQYKQTLGLKITELELTSNTTDGVTHLTYAIASLIPGLKKWSGGIKKVDEETKKALKTNLEFMAQMAIIIASVTGIIVTIKTIIENFVKFQNNIEITSTKLESLQVSLYNIQQEQSNINKLGDEFESLAGKISLSNEELQRQKDIIAEINEDAGYEAVDVNANERKQLQQIRAAEQMKEYEKQYTINAMSNTVAEGYKTAKSGDEAASISAIMGGVSGGAALTGTLVAAGTAAAVGGPVGWILGAGLAITALLGAGLAQAGYAIGEAAGDFGEGERKKYIEEIMSKQSTQESLKQYAQANIDGLDQLSNEMQQVVLDMTVDAADELENNMIDETGFNLTQFKETIANEKLFDALRSVEDSETISDTWDAIKDLSDVQKNYLAGAESSLGALIALQEKGTNVNALVKQLDSKNIKLSDFSEVYQNLSDFLYSFGYNTKQVNEQLAQVTADLADGATLFDAVSQIINAAEITAEQAAEAQEKIKTIESGSDSRYKFQAGTLTQEIEALDTIEDKNSDEYIRRMQAVRDANVEIAKSNELLKRYADQGLAKFQTNLEILNISFPVKSASDFADSLTTLDSQFERLYDAVSDFSSLDISEQLKLLQDYPELAQSILTGTITAAEIQDTLRNRYEELRSGSTTSMRNLMESFRTMFGRNITQADAVSVINSSDDAIAALYGLDKNKMTIAEYQSRINTIKEYATDYIELQFLINQAQRSTYETFIENQFSEQLKAMKNINERLKTEVDLLKQKLELLDAESEEYKTIQKNIQNLNYKRLSSALGAIDVEQMRKDITTLVKDENVVDDFFTFGASTGITVDWSGILDSQYKTEILSGYEAIIDKVNQWSDTINSAYSVASEIVDDYVKELENQTEAENDMLTKRKEMYENYFDAIDKLNEEQDTITKRENIISQLSALSTGINSSTKTKIKELQAQLNQIEEESLQAQQEQIRQQLLDNIKDKISINNEKLEENTSALKAATVAIISNNKDFMTDGQVDMSKIRDFYEKAFKNTTENAKGGLVDYTGFAWVDGTPSKPEAFLSAQDTFNIGRLLDAFNIMLSTSTPAVDSEYFTDSNYTTDIKIEQININTQQLNNSQDFTSAGKILAKEFAKVIQERGLNVNVRK